MWIESHEEIGTHPKTLDLMTLMAWDIDMTIGKLHRLWWWVARYAEDGDLRKYRPDQIALGIGVQPSEADGLISALIQSGWLDSSPYLRVHDWWDYIGLFMQRKYGKHPEKWQAIRQVYSNHTLGVQQVAQPNLTKPNLTKPEKSMSAEPTFKEADWNSFASQHGLPEIKQLTRKRKTAVNSRLRDPGFSFEKIKKEILASDFLRGSNDRDWRVHFDFVFCSPDNYLKILEGRYRNGSPRGSMSLLPSKTSGKGASSEVECNQCGALVTVKSNEDFWKVHKCSKVRSS